MREQERTVCALCVGCKAANAQKNTGKTGVWENEWEKEKNP